jgi:hypothetical protein
MEVKKLDVGGGRWSVVGGETRLRVEVEEGGDTPPLVKVESGQR